MDEKYTLLQVRSVAIAAVYYEPNYEKPAEFNNALQRLFNTPLIKFTEAYETFIGSIVKCTDSYNYWVELVLNSVSNLGDNAPAMLEVLIKTSTSGLEGLLGWESNDIKKSSDREPISLDYMLLFAMRVYANFVTDMLEVTVGGEGE